MKYLPYILGIAGIVFAFLFTPVSHIASIAGMILGIREFEKTERITGLALSIIAEGCSVFSSILGAAALSGVF